MLFDPTSTRRLIFSKEQARMGLDSRENVLGNIIFNTKIFSSVQNIYFSTKTKAKHIPSV